MNIAVQGPGLSFEVRIAGGYKIEPRVMSEAWRSYEASGDGLYPSDKFMLQTMNGALWHFFVIRKTPAPSECVAAWGLELLADSLGPFTSFVYFDKRDDHLRLAAFAPAVIETCHGFTKAMHDAAGAPGPARLLLRGRDGWQRMLPLLGIKIDPDGWITEDQERFHHGHFRRQ